MSKIGPECILFLPSLTESSFIHSGKKRPAFVALLLSEVLFERNRETYFSHALGSTITDSSPYAGPNEKMKDLLMPFVLFLSSR